MYITAVDRVMYNRLRNNNEPKINQTNSIFINHSNKQVAFQAITLTRFQNFLYGILEKQRALTAGKAINILHTKESGLYALTDKGFKFFTQKNFLKSSKDKITEIIVKNPIANNIHRWDVDNKFNLSNHSFNDYRYGFNVADIANLVSEEFPNLTKAEAISDNGLEILSIPKDKILRQKAFEHCKENPDAELLKQQPVFSFAISPQQNFEMAQKMVKEANIPGFAFKKINLEVSTDKF